MAYTTYRYVVSDILLQLKSYKPDSEISSLQVLMWVRMAENFVMQRHLKTEKTGSYLSEYTSVPVQSDTNTPPRKWVVLPTAIFDIMDERGIEYISYQTTGVLWGGQTRFQETAADKAPLLFANPYTTPSPSTPYFYRVGANIYLLGIENASVSQVQMGLYSALDPRPDYVNIDTPISINEEQLPALKQMVLEMGRFSLVVPQDRLETGNDDRADDKSISGFAKATQQPQQEE